MKKIFNTFAFAAVAAVAFTACNKEIENINPVDEQEQVFTFAIGDKSGATKSILGSDANGRFVQFDADDTGANNGLGSIAPNAQGYSSVTPASGDTPATFSIYTKGVTEGNEIFVWYPYRSKQTDKTAVELVIPAEQHHKTGNAFDMKAMPMVTKKIVVDADMVAATSGNNTPIATINFANMGSLLNFKVFSTSESYVDEKVKSITFNAKNAAGTEDANIGGTFTKNLSTIDPDNEETMTIASFTEGVSSIVTSPVADAAIGATKGAALDLYMVVAPGTYKGTIVVRTDAAEYTYTITTAANLARSGIKAYGLDLNSANVVRVVKPESYTITQADVPFSGSGYNSYSDVEIIDAAFSFTDIMKSGTDKFQMKATTGVIENTTAVGSKIESIEFSTTTNSVTVTAGSTKDALSESNVTASGDKYTFSDGCKFFKIATGSKYAVIGAITVNYYPDNTIWNLSSIEVTKEPDKTVYEAGEDFDATGMEVTAHYVDAADDTHTKDVVLDNGDLTISPSTSLTAGTTSVIISYGGQNTTQDITVTAPITWDLRSIAVTTAPTKTTYTAGETFDPTGMVVTATYENHDNTEQTKQEIIANDDLTFSPSTSTALTTSDASVTITYNGKETNLIITVSAASDSYYVKVTSELNDWSGQYLIVSGTVAFTGAFSGASTNYGLKADVTISNDKIESTTIVDAYAVTIAESGSHYSISTVENGYLSWTSGNSLNHVQTVSSDNHRWTLSYSSGNVTIANAEDSTRELQYNSSNPRFACYTSSQTAIQLYKLEDNRQEAGMSWSPDNATATYSNGNTLSFTAPTLTPGNATGITYESTDETIATINASGVVSITALSDNSVKEGSTTIKAVFAGDTNYKPQTVSYTLNVVDSRAAVATPTFDPAAGEVAANTTVNFQCADSDVTYHYTVDGSDPTVESATATSVTIDAAKTVKVIATKTGYKPSSIASAAYTIAGGGGSTPTEQTIFLETFGTAGNSTPAYGSYTGYTATTSMFTTNADVNTHYSGDGKVGKSTLAASNLSNSYTDASGNSGCYHAGVKDTQKTIIQVSDINIAECTNLKLSFGALGGSNSHKINVSYIIDGGAETALITNGSLSSTSWTLMNADISGTGSSLTLIFKHTPGNTWTIRLDDIKVVGTK